jgi:hypothetical protein
MKVVRFIHVYRSMTLNTINETKISEVGIKGYNKMINESVTKKDLVVYREMLPTDLNFCIHSWLESIRDDKHYRLISNIDFYEFMNDRIKKKIGVGRTIIACNPEDNNEIYGFANSNSFNSDKNIINFVFVKKDYRKARIATTMLGILFPLIGQCEINASEVRIPPDFKLADAMGIVVLKDGKPIYSINKSFAFLNNTMKKYLIRYNPFI